MQGEVAFFSEFNVISIGGIGAVIASYNRPLTLPIAVQNRTKLSAHGQYAFDMATSEPWISGSGGLWEKVRAAKISLSIRGR